MYNEGNPNNFTMQYNIPGGGSVDVSNLEYIIANSGGVKTLVDGVIGTDGDDYITGTDDADTIVPGAGNDIIVANGGDDVIEASSGNDIINLGSGNTTVKIGMSILTGEVQQEGTEYEWIDYKENGAKTIYMQNDSVLTLDFAKEIFDNWCNILCRGTGQDNNLYISLSNSDNPPYGIVIKDYFDENGNPKTDNVKFNIWGEGETPETYTVPEWTNAMLIPWHRVFDVQPFGPYEGEIRGTNMPHETLLYSAGFGDDTIYGGNGNEDNIFLHGGNDVIYANEGIKHLNISGNTTNCEIHLGSAETTKTSINLGLVEGNVKSSINAEGDLNVSWDCYANNAEDPYIYSSTLSVIDWNNRTSYATFSIGGNDRDNTLNGINGADNMIDGGKGDDILIGGTGVDTFNFDYNNEYGIDTVKNYTSDDILRFESASSYGVDFTKFKYYTNDNGKGLVINTKNIYSKDSYVIIDNYFETDNKIDTVTTYNWSSPDETKSLATMYGNVDDLGSFDLGTGVTLLGTDNADVFIAKNGTNTYTGGKGNDSLTSKDGENTFVFNSGDGSDILYQSGGSVTLKFNNATIEELSSITGYDRDADGYINDLLIHYDGENTLRVKDYFYKNYVTKIIDSTDTEYNMTDYFKRVEYIDSMGADYMRQYSSKDEELRITAEVYRAEGKGGSDIIIGSNYDEELYTHKADNYSFTTFDKTEGVVDKIHAGGGDDILVGNSSTNYLYGDEGNDTFVVFASKGLNTFVSDSSGMADSMNIYDETYDNLHFVFNIDIDGNMDSNGLRILNNENFNLWKANMSDTNIKGINILEQWNSIETYEEAGDANGCSHLNISAIETVKTDIVSWLAANDYADVANVFANEKTEGDINTLIAKFDVKSQWIYKEY